MRYRSTRFIRRSSYLRPLGLALLGVPLVIIVTLLGAAKVTQVRLASRILPPGQLIDVGGHRLHLLCQGPLNPVGPTIVFEAGLGESALTWAPILPALTADHRVCAYDRAGMGWSDSRPSTPSAITTITDLHTLLHTAAEPGPYVLVGHSIGGLYARLFAHRYPSETAGLVLLDPSHEEMTSRLPPDWQAFVRETNDEAAAELRVPALLADLGLAALFPQFAPADIRLPATAQAMLRALGGASGKGFRTLAQDIAASETILAEVRAAQITSLGDLPLVVIKAGATVASEPSADLSPFTPSYDLHRELATQSTRGRLITLHDSTHYVHYDAPEQVIDAIAALLEDLRSQAVPLQGRD